MMMKSSTVVVAILALSASVARADDSPDHRDPALATALSIGGVLASGALLQSHNSNLEGLGLVSSLVTPSFGHWYAGEYLTVGMGIRAASVGVMIAGFSQGVCVDGCDPGHSGGGLGIVLLGLGGYAGGTLYDIATAHTAANNFNRKHALQLAPMVAPGHAPGLGLSGRF